ncbi:MAG: hypothetical protein ACK5LJ_16590 [Paracoccus sp. (in: a-proteobacteria)]
MIVERVNRPVGQVVTIDELGWHTRTGGPAEMGENPHWPELERFADAAGLEAEDSAQIALLTQRVRVTLEAWPRALTLSLPIAPLLDFASVTVSADGKPFEDFGVMTGLRPALRFNARPVGLVVIEYSAGFGDTAEAVPKDLRLAIMDQVACYFDARGVVDVKARTQSPHFARIIGRYRGVRA